MFAEPRKMTSTLPVSLAAPPTLAASYSLFGLIAGPTLYPWEFLSIYAHATQAYGTGHPRLRAFYTPPQAGLLYAAELPLRAFSDKYLQRFDPQSRQHLINHMTHRA
jgi:hypothetical protein